VVLKLIRYVWKLLICGAGKRWIDFERNEVMHRAKEERNNLHAI